MDLNSIAFLIAAIGTLFAGIALILNFLQFRRLEESIRGNTYQQLAQYAVKIKELLLSYPDIQYLYTQTGGEFRHQEVFDRLIGNYLEDIWFQKKYGLIDEEMWQAYEELVREIVKDHPGVIKHMMHPNFSSSLRNYIQKMSPERSKPVAE